MWSEIKSVYRGKAKWKADCQEKWETWYNLNAGITSSSSQCCTRLFTWSHRKREIERKVTTLGRSSLPPNWPTTVWRGCECWIICFEKLQKRPSKAPLTWRQKGVRARGFQSYSTTRQALQTEGSGIMACCDPSLHPVSTTGTGCFKVYINCSHSFSVVKSLNITIISVKTGFNTLKLSFIKSCRSSLRLCSPLQLFTSSPKQLLWNQANLATCENHGCYVTFHSSLNALKGDHVTN